MSLNSSGGVSINFQRKFETNKRSQKFRNIEFCNLLSPLPGSIAVIIKYLSPVHLLITLDVAKYISKGGFCGNKFNPAVSAIYI